MAKKDTISALLKRGINDDLAEKIGSSGILTGVKDSSGPFLKYLNKKNLALGDRIKVIDIESYDQSVHIETRTHRLVISNNVAENLYLKNVK